MLLKQTLYHDNLCHISIYFRQLINFQYIKAHTTLRNFQVKIILVTVHWEN